MTIPLNTLVEVPSGGGAIGLYCGVEGAVSPYGDNSTSLSAVVTAVQVTIPQ